MAFIDEADRPTKRTPVKQVPKTEPGKYEYWPVNPKTKVTQNWDEHGYAVDIGTPVGTPAIAPTDAKVLDSGYNSAGYGRYVKLKDALGRIIILAHLSNENPLVTTGQTVNAGQLIGYTGGDTKDPGAGNSSGPHLHYEIRTPGGGGYINPYSVYGEELAYETPDSPGQYTTAPTPDGDETVIYPVSFPGLVDIPLRKTVAEQVKKPSFGLVDWEPLVKWFTEEIEWQNLFVLFAGLVLVVIGLSVFIKTEGVGIAVSVAKEVIK